MRSNSLLLALCIASCAACSATASTPLPAPANEFSGVPPIEMGWEGLPDRPPVPVPSPSQASSNTLGDVWEEDEENEWRGTWVRRGRSSLFDAYWVHPSGERVLAVVKIVERGRHVEADRRHPGGKGCTYRGTIAANGVDVSGLYECSWHRHTSAWRARIIRMSDVMPALLSNGASPVNHPVPASPPVVCYGSTTDWRAVIDSRSSSSSSELIVSGVVTTPTGGHETALTLGPITRSSPPEQIVNLELRAMGDIVTAAVTRTEVQARFPALPRYAAVVIRCNGVEVGRVSPSRLQD